MAKPKGFQQYFERGWTYLSIGGGILAALYVGYTWFASQNQDVEAMAVVAPKVQVNEQLLRRMTQKQLATDAWMELECARADTDLPESYCAGVRFQQRMEEDD